MEGLSCLIRACMTPQKCGEREKLEAWGPMSWALPLHLRFLSSSVNSQFISIHSSFINVGR